MRSQLLSLAFGLTILTPSVGISCDDGTQAEASSKPTQVMTDSRERHPSSDEKQQKVEEDNTAKKELFENSHFSKM